MTKKITLLLLILVSTALIAAGCSVDIEGEMIDYKYAYPETEIIIVK